MAESAKKRGTGIAQRSPDYIKKKMEEGKAIIAVSLEGDWVGFCYIEAWSGEKYVANSGLIVSPDYRGLGVAKEIKKRIFELSRKRYPEAKIFGLTTGLAVMKINSELGYEPVPYSELTDDDKFWDGCKSCVNYDILMSKGRTNCLCTAMLFDPAEAKKKALTVTDTKVIVTPDGRVHRNKKRHFKGNLRLFERWIRYKRYVMLKNRRNREEERHSGGGSNTSKKKFLFF